VTALALINRVLWKRLGVAISHRVDGDHWRPWWHGRHVPGSWRIIDAPGFQ
jgi:hypothetical protein